MMDKLDMMYYVRQEKEINQRVIENSYKNLDKFKDHIKGKKYRSIIIYATGSSANAANSARIYMQNILDMPVYIKEPSLAKSYEMFLDRDSLYLAISQGGHSYSTVELVREINRLGYDIFPITSDIQSPIAKLDVTALDIGMGKEEMPFVTAGQTATVVFLWLIALNMALANGEIYQAEFDDEILRLKNVINQADKVIELTDSWYERERDSLLKAKRLVAVSYGAGYGVVKEAETKFTETIRVPSHGHELEEYMHGPYIGLDKDDYIFLVGLEGKLESRLLKLKEFLDLHVEHTYLISTGKRGEDKRDLNLDLDVDEYFAPILATIPFHMISWYMSQELGVDLKKSSYPDFDKMLNSKI